MTAADKIAEVPEPARYADTERNKIINLTSLGLRKIVHDHDPENDNLDIRVWDRLDQMAQEIEARAADLADAQAQENAKLRAALAGLANALELPAQRGVLTLVPEALTRARAALGETP